MEILYINAAVRSGSRTAKLAQYLLGKLDGSVTEVRPNKLGLAAMDESFLEKRTQLCAQGDYSDDMFLPAKQFAKADIAVIAAPFWDLSFPAALKQYFEHINILGLTFAYNADGEPISLCRLKKLYYVTTAGGQIFSQEYGYGYVKALAESFYHAEETAVFKAEMLDVVGSDEAQILRQAKACIDSYFDR